MLSAVRCAAAPLTLDAPLSWRVLHESPTGVAVEVRYHRADDSVGVAVVHVDDSSHVTVLSLESPSTTDLRELREDVQRYARRDATRYLEVARRPAHRHVDPCDPGETYAMPERPCARCRIPCCTDCSSTRNGKTICDGCTGGHDD